MNQCFFKPIQKLLTLVGLKRAPNPTLQAIFIAESAGNPMCSTKTAEAIQNRGLKGDRYCDGSGYWHTVEACQVTLITENDLRLVTRAVDETTKAMLKNGSHRRNLVLGGVKTKVLQGKQFRIGSAEFIYDKPRPPCAYIDKISGRGTCKALGINSGVCIRVTKTGSIAVGDVVEIV